MSKNQSDQAHTKKSPTSAHESDKPTSAQSHAEGKSSSKPEAKHHDDKHEHKKAEPMPGHCRAESCKAKSNRFDFCDEHYEQFKFGLIRKTGEPAADYEKKFEHYAAYKSRMRVQKAA